MTKNVLAAFLLLLVCFSQSNAQHLNIYPTILNFSLSEAGTIETQTINITNNSEKRQAIQAYLGDWNRNIDGSHSYFEPGSKDYSCADWAVLGTNFLEIMPHESAQLVLTMQAPMNQEDLEKMKWAMLYIQGTEVKESEREQGRGVTTQINEVIRMGVHIYQTPMHLNLSEAKAIEFVQSKEDLEVFDMHIENTGLVMVRTKSYLELTNIRTGEEFKGQIEECPIFPLGKRVVSLHLPEGLPKGEYSMLGILDYGDPNSLEAIEQIVEIK